MHRVIQTAISYLGNVDVDIPEPKDQPETTSWPGREEGRIPVAWHSVGAFEADAVRDLLLSGRPLVGGPAVELFEQRFAERVNARYAIATSSGTAALEAAFLAVAPGMVIVPAMTFAATATAAIRASREVKLFDIDPKTLCLDPRWANRAGILVSVGVVAPVHFAGRAALIDPYENIGVEIVEDAAHAVGGVYQDGSPIGSKPNNLCCFSFNIQKNMTTIEGGMVTTGDDVLAREVRTIIDQGQVREGKGTGPWRNVTRQGIKGRMSDLNATIGLVQLEKLDSLIAERRRVAAYYLETLQDVDDIELPPWSVDSSTWHLFPIRSRRRRGLVEYLWGQGIECGTHYRSLNFHSLFRSIGSDPPGSHPYAEIYGEEAVTLPIFPGLRESELQRVVGAVRAHSKC